MPKGKLVQSTSTNQHIAAILDCGCVLYADLTLVNDNCETPEVHQ